MSTIVAFTVSSKQMGEEALERLEGNVQDVAMVYKTVARETLKLA